MILNESTVEEAALSWFRELGYAIGHGPHRAPGESAAERDSFGEVVLARRLRSAIWKLNPDIPEDAREEALRKVLRIGTPSITQANRHFHAQLYGQFQRCHEILHQMPVQAGSRNQLRELLKVASGGVVFTTIQKFLPDTGEKMPELSARRNIVVIADEARGRPWLER